MGLDFNLERTLRLKPHDEIEHKNLYNRAIVELDGRGAQVGRDMIPWVWTTSFRATDFTVCDNVSFETMLMVGRPHAERKTARRNYIQARLKPGRLHQADDLFDHEPTYRFFGTDRVIKDFRLDILPVDDPADEGCTTWGSASYDAEIDFRTEATEDIVQFYLQVSPSLFDRYLWNIGQGLANRIGLAVGFVDGFYSDWSPGVTTREIKVLAGDEHKIEDANGVEMPRLGKIGKVEFFMHGHFDVSPLPPVVAEEEQVEGDEERRGFKWLGRR